MLSPFGLKWLRDIQTSISSFCSAYEIPKETAPSGPCIPGKVRLFVNVNEMLFPCERVNETEVMCIGSLDEGFDIGKVRELLNIASLTEDYCKNCWAIRHCIICAKMCDSGISLEKKAKQKHCSRVINTVETKMRAIILFKEIPQYYSEYIKV